MIPRAKTKNADYIEQINGMLLPNKINQIVVQNIKTDAEKMKPDNPEDAFALLGMIACLEGDLETMHSHHRNSIQYSNSSENYKYHYGISLLNAQLYEDAYEMLKGVLDASDKVDIAIVKHLIQCTLNLGMDDAFDEYLNLLTKLDPNEESPFLLDGEYHNLTCILDAADVEIETDFDNLVPVDHDLFNLANELVEGVNI